MSDYTRGPWTYTDDGRGGWLINGPDSPVGEAGREDNARLMAAAPELLSMLEEAAEAEGWDTEAFAAWQSDAQVAIAKAGA